MVRGQKEIVMSVNQPNIAGIQRAVANALHQHWKLYLAEGIALHAPAPRRGIEDDEVPAQAALTTPRAASRATSASA